MPGKPTGYRDIQRHGATVDDVRRDPAVSRFTASALSPERRAADLRRLRGERFDVLVIGGGVTGAGAALDAASRGLSVALVEARDLAAGTSSRSSKLIHGGLRYLEQLEFGLVHEALRERGLLATRLAPHLVRPVPIPGAAARRDSRASRGAVAQAAALAAGLYYGAGVALYDAFAGSSAAGRGHAAAPAPDRAAAPGGCSRRCARTRSPARSATTTARSTTPGWW